MTRNAENSYLLDRQFNRLVYGKVGQKSTSIDKTPGKHNLVPSPISVQSDGILFVPITVRSGVIKMFTCDETAVLVLDIFENTGDPRFYCS